ncbi:hypothetical protein, partial [Staphylococcus aureus]|uniref:hypothetical protein n=1 Tax=Staphylococcus aureus TaxID=1280 RepID=UPI00289991EE
MTPLVSQSKRLDNFQLFTHHTSQSLDTDFDALGSWVAERQANIALTTTIRVECRPRSVSDKLRHSPR